MDLSRTSRTPQRRGLIRGFGWLFAAGLLAFAALAPATVSAATVYATVDGYAAGTPDNNNPETWGSDCTKTADGANLGDSFTVDQAFAKIIVKAGSEQSNPGFVNTIFNDVAAGETVWADTNGDGIFNPGGPDGDKGISHIIFCGPVETTTTSTSTETTSTETTSTETTSTETTSTETTSTETTSQSSTTSESSTTTQSTSTGTESSVSTTTTSSSTGEELGVVGTPGVTPPPTDTASVAATAGSDTGFRIVLIGLSMLLMVLLLLQPKEAFVRNK